MPAHFNGPLKTPGQPIHSHILPAWEHKDQGMHLGGGSTVKVLAVPLFSGQLCLTLQHCFREGETSEDVISLCI